MMKKVLAAALMFCAGAAFAAVSDDAKIEDRVITEGEFAVLYCAVLNASEPEGGWTAEEAIRKLHSLKVYHPQGWQPSADLTEGVMVELVRFLGIELVTAYPDRKVTVRHANAVFNIVRKRNFKLHPEYRTSKGEPATFIDYEGNPGTEMSPSSF